MLKNLGTNTQEVKKMNENVGTALFLGIGIVVTYYQAKWYEYDPDKDF